MSRITGREVSELMEAYASIYVPQQEVVEEVVEEETEQIDEIAVNFGGQAALAAKQKELAQQRQSSARIDALRQQRFGSGGSPSAKGGAKTRAELTGSARPAAPAAPARPAAPAPAARPAAPAPAARPAAPAPAAAKPAPSGQTGDKAKDMATWAKANPTLANKPKTANPLMQKTFGYQTGNAPDQIAKASAGAPPTPSGGALGAAAKPEVRKALNLPAKPSAAPEVKQTAEIAKKPVQPAVAPTPTQMRQGTFREEVDAYDLVLDYLLENGHVDTLDEAHYVMLEMDSEMIQNIAEAKRKSYSAKKARKGEDIGLPGKGFEKITKEAGKRYGSKKRGEKVAGAVLAGLRAKYGK